MEGLQVKQIEVQGYTYKEYHGHGSPSSTLEPRLNIGDVYLDISGPYQVWVCGNGDWKEWVSMQRTQECPHPTKPHVLMPTTKRFSWVSSAGVEAYKETVIQRLSGRKDDTNTHVGIILSGEGVIQPTPIVLNRSTEMQTETVPTERKSEEEVDTDKDTDKYTDKDTDGNTDDEKSDGQDMMKDDDDQETGSRRSSDVSMKSRLSMDTPPTVHESIEVRTLRMRMENMSIHKATQAADSM